LMGASRLNSQIFISACGTSDVQKNAMCVACGIPLSRSEVWKFGDNDIRWHLLQMSSCPQPHLNEAFICSEFQRLIDCILLDTFQYQTLFSSAGGPENSKALRC